MTFLSIEFPWRSSIYFIYSSFFFVTNVSQGASLVTLFSGIHEVEALLELVKTNHHYHPVSDCKYVQDE